jgi:hypothetical protein
LANGGVEAPPRPSFTADEVAAARDQLEYYFSASNLCRDMYLRSAMDAQGFVALAFVATFNKMRPFPPPLLLAALETSQQLQTIVPWTGLEFVPDAAILVKRRAVVWLLGREEGGDVSTWRGIRAETCARFSELDCAG